MKHEIEIPDFTEGWEPVAYRIPKAGEYYFGSQGVKLAHIDFENLWLVVRKKQPRRDLYDPLRFAEGLIEQLPDDHEGAINWLMNNGDGEKADNLRKKYSHPQPRRIVLEETGQVRKPMEGEYVQNNGNYCLCRKPERWGNEHEIWKIVDDGKCAE